MIFKHCADASKLKKDKLQSKHCSDILQTIAERRSKSAALRAALSKVGARARAALFKKDGSASASGALKNG